MSFSRLSAAALSLVVVASIVAGCGGSSSSSSSSASAPSEGGGASTISGAENSELGTILVDAKGFTVYSFAKDQGTTSSCYGECAEAWPPVIVKGEPTAGEGAESSELGTTKRKDGTTEVTYAGHPLYTFFEDEKPGEAKGNGVNAFGAVWNALDESGSATAGGGGATGGGGY
jgi:predicted lipoprotein with Yx(FWY)xxD motif